MLFDLKNEYQVPKFKEYVNKLFKERAVVEVKPFMGIELKTKTGRQSDYQKAYQKEFDSIGAKYVVVRSLEEFIAVVTDYLKEK